MNWSETAVWDVIHRDKGVASFLCGFFWEMWNFYSLAKWVYHVPFVQRFHLFEMPLLGYAGYLPFGMESLVMAEMVLGRKRTH